jgi:hypothetical protein
MYLSYSNINLSINGSNILCQSVSFNQSSPLKPIFNIGNKVSYNAVPTTLSNSISIEYLLEPNIEPNYSVITGLIYDKTSSLPSIINLGNVYITGYLKDFSLQVYPNSPIKIKSSFNIYNPITGNIIEQASNDSSLYDVDNSNGISHYWSTQFTSGNSAIDTNILQLEYNASINLVPIYSIGDYQPKQIFIEEITESIDLIMEQQVNITYSGKIFDSIFTGVQNILFTGIGLSSGIDYGYTNISASSFLDFGSISISPFSYIDYGLTSQSLTNYKQLLIPLTGFILDDFNTNISTDNIVLFGYKFKRYN